MSRPYIHTAAVHNFNAAEEVVPHLMRMVNPTSVLDVGCGLGTWLNVFARHGVADYLGIDGDYVERDKLTIPATHFRAVDLTTPWKLDRKFDLVLCLEVAEHLPETCADHLVHSLVNHGEIVLFSAAIPGQGGQNHLNEQWPDYWQRKFANYGFHFHDDIRPLVWENDRIDWWYRQNMFLITEELSNTQILRTVHPECMKSLIDNNAALTRANNAMRLSWSWRITAPLRWACRVLS